MLAKPLAVMVEVKVFSPVKVCVEALETSPAVLVTQDGAAAPLLCRIWPAVPAASSPVASGPVWYGSCPRDPPAIFVALTAVVAVAAFPVMSPAMALEKVLMPPMVWSPVV